MKEEVFQGDDRHFDMINSIKQMADFMTHPGQKKYYLDLLSVAHPVRVVSAYEVFTPDRVTALKELVRPAKKECYRVATLLSQVTDGEALYTEGQFHAVCLGVDHAFNYIPEKDVYVDFTVEFALERDPSKEAYIAFRTFDNETLLNMIVKNQCYGDIYRYVWFEENRDLLKK